ncbi:hypothetical protein, partial [Raoultella ornithinolytica]|uniref:hypothetical protein n=1 Tax=Raoultella ornithinolytica TaxID=54291 RepID=UPI001D00EB64
NGDRAGKFFVCPVTVGGVRGGQSRRSLFRQYEHLRHPLCTTHKMRLYIAGIAIELGKAQHLKNNIHTHEKPG